ncbi:MAG: F0F1 ATP synthase subunit A [Pseudomonadota bacterium]
MASDSEGGIKIDPMAQFDIKPFFSDEVGALSFTNSTLWMAIVVLGAAALFFIGSQRRALVPTRLQSVAELMYEFIYKMVRDTAGEEGLKYFPYIFTLFIFILFSNLFGMIPMSFTVTSHLAVTALLALIVFVTVTVIGFMKHGSHFFSFFAPSGTPAPLLLLLVPIEVISYFVRPVTHSIRLGANMMAGHATMKVFAGFLASAAVLTPVVLPVMVAFTAFEVLVAVVQAYIFTILTCIYLNDALHLHH